MLTYVIPDGGSHYRYIRKKRERGWTWYEHKPFNYLRNKNHHKRSKTNECEQEYQKIQDKK